MTDPYAQGTKQRIVDAAAALFAERGYQRSSVREIAERVGLTKAAVLYHFPTKEHILAEVFVPVITELESVLAEAEQLPPDEARWRVVEGAIDTALAHRELIAALAYDLALLARREPVFDRFIRVFVRMNELILGPRSGPVERIRAAQVTVLAGDPIVFLDDLPADVVRAELLEGVRRLLGTEQGTAGMSAGGRGAGRPSALSAEQVAAARRMYAQGGHSAAEIAELLGVSRATIYRYLRDDR